MENQVTSYPKEKVNILLLENISQAAADQFTEAGYASVKRISGALSEEDLIIETASGMPYKTFLENTFFKPLQMKDTYVFTPDDMGRALPSYEWNNKKFPFEFLDVVYGDKNIYSTVRDMLKWDQALYPGKLFQKTTLDSAFAPYSFEKEGKRNYGLGWRMTFLDNGKKMLYHNGWWHGNNTVFIRMPDAFLQRIP